MHGQKIIQIPFVLILLSLALTASSLETTSIEDRAGFRRPTAEMLELEGEIRTAVETRASLGLSADLETVMSLQGSPEDVGSAEYGIPLTAAETAEVTARFAFAAAAHEALGPFVENLPTFAGVFFNHQAGGELVILLTTADETVEAEIRSLAPLERPTRIEIVEYSQAQLREALPLIRETWIGAGGPEIYALAVDTPANAVRVDVDVSNLEAAEKLAREVGASVNLPVFVALGERPIETACTNRENCTSPMKGGIVIRKGSTTGVRCTMGFHIQAGSDERFVTAGHCGYSGSNNWYHVGWGLVGSELDTQYYSGGRDIMTVQISDSQDSSLLYSSQSIAVTTTWDPWTGEGVCASLGVSSSSWVCGTISDDYLSWTGASCSCTVYGGKSTVTTVSGDSGSPYVDANYRYVAIGIHNASGGYFAIVDDALAAWGHTVRQ